MRIGIEAQRIFRAKKHGMDLVALEVIKQLQELNTDDEYFVFVASGPDVCLGDTKCTHNIATLPILSTLGANSIAVGCEAI